MVQGAIVSNVCARSQGHSRRSLAISSIRRSISSSVVVRCSFEGRGSRRPRRRCRRDAARSGRAGPAESAGSPLPPSSSASGPPPPHPLPRTPPRSHPRPSNGSCSSKPSAHFTAAGAGTSSGCRKRCGATPCARGSTTCHSAATSPAARSRRSKRSSPPPGAPPMADMVRARWLERLARQGRWTRFLDVQAALPPGRLTSRLRCHRARALFETGDDAAGFEAAAALWLVPRSQDEACDPVFTLWVRKDGRTPEHLWDRTGLALRRGNPGLARHVARMLEPSERGRRRPVDPGLPPPRPARVRGAPRLG